MKMTVVHAHASIMARAAASALALSAIMAGAARGGESVWTGAGGDALWSTPANWDGEVPSSGAPTAVVFDSVGAASQNDIEPAPRVSSLTLAPRANQFTLSGLPIALSGAITNNSGYTIVASSGAILEGDLHVTGTHNTLFNNGPLTEDGVAPRSIVKTGTGALSLQTQASHTGGTFLRQGSMQLNFNAPAPLTQMLAETGRVIMGGAAGGPSFNLQSRNTGHSVQTIDSLRLEKGASRMYFNAPNTANGSLTVNIGEIDRQPFSALWFEPFSSASAMHEFPSAYYKVNIDPATPLEHGILGGWAYAGFFVTPNPNQPPPNIGFLTHNNGVIERYTDYTVHSGANAALNAVASDNILIDSESSAGDMFLVADTEANTIRITDNADRALDLGGRSLRLGKTGAFLRSTAGYNHNSDTANTVTITNGILTAGGADDESGELFIITGARAVNANGDGAHSAGNAHGNVGVALRASVADNGAGAVALMKLGAQDLELQATNTYSGGTHIFQGPVRVFGPEALPGDVFVYSDLSGDSGQVKLYGAGVYTNNFFIGGSGSPHKYSTIQDYNIGAIAFMAPNVELSGTVTLADNARISACSPVNIATLIAASITGKITGPGQLTVGAGHAIPVTMNIHNPLNDWDGGLYVVAGGTSAGRHAHVVLQASEVIPNGPGKGDVQLQSSSSTTANAIFSLNGNDETINGLSGAVRSAETRQDVKNNTANAPATLTLGDADASAGFYGIIRNGDNNATHKPLSIRKIGAGRQEFAGSATYTGFTAVDSGSLVMSSGSFDAAGGEISINANAAFAYLGGSQVQRSVVISNGGFFAYSSPLPYSGALDFQHGGGIGGTNWLGSLDGLTIGAGRRLEAGFEDIALVAAGSQSWADGGALEIDISNPYLEDGAGIGWDCVAYEGALDISGITAPAAFRVKVSTLTPEGKPGELSEFDPFAGFELPIATFGSLSGAWSSTKFELDTTDFITHAPPRGRFVLSRRAASIVLRHARDNATLLIVR